MLEELSWGVSVVQLSSLYMQRIDGGQYTNYIGFVRQLRIVKRWRGTINIYDYKQTSEIVRDYHTCIHLSQSASGFAESSGKELLVRLNHAI